MDARILFVDDEQHVLASYRRMLRKKFEIVTALGGETALEIFNSKGPFAVVVSDMRMPGMNGVQLPSKIKEKSPDTVRMMLTGYADFNTAMEAVNEGNIFRFLTKPCPPELLTKAVQEGIRQYELVKMEHELLNKTLKGSIQVLIEILSMVDQKSFSQALKLRDYIRKLGKENIISSAWELEIAALLSQIGQVTIPASVIDKIHEGQELNDVENTMVQKIPKIGHDLVVKIPRLDMVAKSILYQNKHFDGSGFPEDDVRGLDLPQSSRLLKILNDLTSIENKGKMRKEAFEIMSKQIGAYDPNMLQIVMNKFFGTESQPPEVKKETLTVEISKLIVGLKLLENIETTTGQILVLAGQEITESVIVRVRNWAKLYKIKEPVEVQKTNPVIDTDS